MKKGEAFPSEAQMRFHATFESSNMFASSVVTETTIETFYPPRDLDASKHHSAFKPLGKKFKKTVVIDLNDESRLFRDDKRSDNIKKKSKKRRSFLVLCILLLFLGGAGSTGYLLLLQENNAVETEDFCLSVGVSDDEMRQVLAINFDAAAAEGELDAEIDYDGAVSIGLDIPCLPENAFQLLSEDQRSLIKLRLDGLRFNKVGLELIHPRAFEKELIEAHTEIKFLENPLIALPDGLFRDFESLEFMSLFGSSFVTLNNDIFKGGAANFTHVSLASCLSLIEMPIAFSLALQLEILNLRLNTAISIGDPQAFSSLSNLKEIIFSPDAEIIIENGVQGVANALNVDINILRILE